MGIQFRRATLDNGLQIIGEIDPDSHTAACGFFVNTGARDEKKESMGVSHFLEHMMFKGTERRSADDVNREFDEIGANYNAFTSHEMTAFWAHTLPEALPHAIDILADIMRPALRDSDFQTERGVILEEIAMYDDVPFWRVYERAQERFYGEHPLGYRVLGTKSTIADLKRDEMLAYFTRRYSADNTIFSVAGAIDFDSIVEETRRRCGKWRRTDTQRLYPPMAHGDDAFTIEDPKINRSYMIMVSPGPAAKDPRRYAANMLASVLGHHEGSLLYWALVDTGIAEEAQAGYDGRDGSGEFYVYASCPPERSEQVESVIDDQIRRVLELTTDDDLDRFRNKTATAVTLAGERPAGRMKRLGRVWAHLGEYLSLEEELARIQSVTIDDLQAVYEAFPFQPRVIGRLRPAKA